MFLCRSSFGYRPFIISTIVDRTFLFANDRGYRPFIISTIVDLKNEEEHFFRL